MTNTMNTITHFISKIKYYLNHLFFITLFIGITSHNVFADDVTADISIDTYALTRSMERNNGHWVLTYNLTVSSDKNITSVTGSLVGVPDDWIRTGDGNVSLGDLASGLQATDSFRVVLTSNTPDLSQFSWQFNGTPVDDNDDTGADILHDWMMNTEQQYSTYIPDALVHVESVINNGDSVTISASGIPDYQVLINQNILDAAAKHPSGDFSDGQGLTATLGDVVEFGQNVGWAVSPIGNACFTTGGEGYWPPGPDCPFDSNKSMDFPVIPNVHSSLCETGNGAIGYMINGTSVYNWSDARVDNNIWQRNAPVFEQYDMDICSGHAANGDYHHHFNSECLANTVNDLGTGHSPVYGFAKDGYAIYGPWHNEGVLAASSWRIRDYTDPIVGCSDGERSCLMVNEFDPSQGTTSATTTGYDLGYPYTLQPDFRGGTIYLNAGAYYQDMYWDETLANQGEQYLDVHNGHDHDQLGYHYHITVTRDEEDELTPAFPYIIGPTFYGECQ
ncbi:YHYH protein [Shewanella surugensis]|uniref:YHYH protein n=1 Tax=Shewanella surugensis TaxID=212020 RepID=A0ABT0LEC7_9GAMM|nr:YHYH protein [Shewanella surugensis]MCL1125682.1 YHYH protein [Shewanella surugensis]